MVLESLKWLRVPETVLELELEPKVEEVVEGLRSLVPGCLELVVPDCRELVVPDCRELVEFQDCWELVEFQEIGAGEDPQVKEGWEAPGALEALLVIEAGKGPQVRVALGVLSQLLSCCFRRPDAMVQVGTGRALLGRQQLW